MALTQIKKKSEIPEASAITDLADKRLLVIDPAAPEGSADEIGWINFTALKGEFIIHPTTVLPVFKFNVSLKVGSAGSFTNLKRANGSAAQLYDSAGSPVTSNLVTTEESAAPFFSLDYNAATDTWRKGIKNMEISDLKPTAGLTEMFAPESELSTFTGGTSFTGTVIILKAATFNMRSIKVWCTTAGTLRFGAYTMTETVSTRQRYVDAELTLGVNEIPLAVNVGERVGLYENDTTFTGRIGQKVISGVYTYRLFDDIEVAGGATHTGFPTGTNVWLAISTGFGRTFADKVAIVESDVAAIKNSGAIDYSNILTYNLETPLPSISRHSKRLVKGVVLSDSLWANGDPVNFGGPLPTGLSMPAGENPMRGTFYNLFMRAYETLCHNRPNTPKNRRVNHSDWLSTGTWTAINNETIWEPAYTNETYHYTTSPGASKTIPILPGCENMALILREASGCANVDFSLNGGSIAAHGPTSFDTNYANVGHTGNPYKILEWHDVPSGGNNTFTLTKDNTSDPLYVWGAFFWTGNTVILINMSHGGHALGDILTQHWADEYLRNDWDFTIFQLTELNDTRVNNLAQSVVNSKTMLDVIQLKDCITMSCIPFGGTLYNTTHPGQKNFNNAFKKEILDRNLPFIDFFSLYERAVISMGRTLEDGGASLFQWDNQHMNNKGHEFQDAVLQTIYKRTPIY